LKAKVYIETSVISYLTAHPNNDIRAMANQNVTRPKIEATCRALGYEPPIICTPQELTEEV